MLIKESPDWFIDPKTRKKHEFNDADAVPFGVYNNEFHYRINHRRTRENHTRMKEALDIEEFDISGRLWHNPKMITFWIFPTVEKFKWLISEIEKELEIEISGNNWRVEVYKESGKAIYIPIENYMGEYHDPEKVDHVLSPMDKKKSDSPSYDKYDKLKYPPARWSFYKDENITEEMINREIETLFINEDPNFVEGFKMYTMISYSDPDAVVFLRYLKDKKLYYLENVKSVVYTHTDIKLNFNLDDIKNTTDRGRLWKVKEVMTFWDYPSKQDFFKLISELEKELNLKIMNNGWMVEVYPNENKFGKKLHSIFIPVEDYQGKYYNPPQVDHILPPSKKQKPDKPPYDKYKNQKILPARWNFHKHKNVAEEIINREIETLFINEDPNFVEDNTTNDSEYYATFYDSDAVVFLRYIHDGEIYYIENDGLYKTHKMIADYFDFKKPYGRYIKERGRLWKNKKLISFWDYPNKQNFLKLIADLQRELNIRIKNNNWMVEVYPTNDKSKSILIPVEDYQGKYYNPPPVDHVLPPSQKQKQEKPPYDKYKNQKILPARWKFYKDKNVAESIIREETNKFINEELGISNFAEELYEMLENEAWEVDFDDLQNGVWHLISEITFEKNGHHFEMDLEVAFLDEKKSSEYINYPIIDGSLRSSYMGREVKVRLILKDEFKEGNDTSELFYNSAIKGVIMHELHHFIRHEGMKFFGGENPRVKEMDYPFMKYLSENPTEELGIFYYYLNKVELAAIIPEMNYDKRREIIDLFKKVRNMDYNDFSTYIYNNDNERIPSMKEYKKVQNRVKYFLKKIRKLGISE